MKKLVMVNILFIYIIIGASKVHAERNKATPKPTAITVITYSGTSTGQTKTSETTLLDGSSLKITNVSNEGITITKTNSDGVVQVKDPNGQTTTTTPDGTISLLDVNGTLKINDPSGVVTTIAKTGETTIIDPKAGTTTTITETGTKTIIETSTQSVVSTEIVTPPTPPILPSIDPIREVNTELSNIGITTVPSSLTGQCTGNSASGC